MISEGKWSFRGFRSQIFGTSRHWTSPSREASSWLARTASARATCSKRLRSAQISCSALRAPAFKHSDLETRAVTIFFQQTVFLLELPEALRLAESNVLTL